MLNSKRLKCAAAVLGMAAAGMIGTVASASAGSGITPERFVLAADLLDKVHYNHDRIKFQEAMSLMRHARVRKGRRFM